MPAAGDRGRVELDGSRGEGGGQILRTALTLSMLTGRPFRMKRIRANREKPGLRPQHLAAVEAAAELSGARASGAYVGSSKLEFEPGAYEARDLEIDIGTAGATSLVLQTLHLAIAMKATGPVRLSVRGGTFNLKAPSFPFLDRTWRRYQELAGLPVALSMPEAGFYPRGGGRLEAWIEPGRPMPLRIGERGPVARISGVSGVGRLPLGIAERMKNQALERLGECGLGDVPVEIEVVEWPAASTGAAIALVAESLGGVPPATFVGLGERGKPAERVADEAVDELIGYVAGRGAVDEHSADQLVMPMCLAEGPSEYTVATVTEHLRTNVETIGAFLGREIRIEEGDEMARVVVR